MERPVKDALLRLIRDRKGNVDQDRAGAVNELLNSLPMEPGDHGGSDGLQMARAIAKLLEAPEELAKDIETVISDCANDIDLLEQARWGLQLAVEVQPTPRRRRSGGEGQAVRVVGE